MRSSTGSEPCGSSRLTLCCSPSGHDEGVAEGLHVHLLGPGVRDDPIYEIAREVGHDSVPVEEVLNWPG